MAPRLPLTEVAGPHEIEELVQGTSGAIQSLAVRDARKRPWLIFLGFRTLSVTFSVPHGLKWIPVIGGSLVLGGHHYGHRIRGRPFVDMAGFLDCSPSRGAYHGRRDCHCSARSPFVVPTVVAGGQGVAGAYNLAPSGALYAAGTIIPLLIVWLLFGVPDQARNIGLDTNGYTQQVLVGIVAALAAALTGCFFSCCISAAACSTVYTLAPSLLGSCSLPYSWPPSTSHWRERSGSEALAACSAPRP